MIKYKKVWFKIKDKKTKIKSRSRKVRKMDGKHTKGKVKWHNWAAAS